MAGKVQKADTANVPRVWEDVTPIGGLRYASYYVYGHIAADPAEGAFDWQYVDDVTGVATVLHTGTPG